MKKLFEIADKLQRKLAATPKEVDWMREEGHIMELQPDGSYGNPYGSELDDAPDTVREDDSDPYDDSGPFDPNGPSADPREITAYDAKFLGEALSFYLKSRSDEEKRDSTGLEDYYSSLFNKLEGIISTYKVS